jgi:hypothetical protein
VLSVFSFLGNHSYSYIYSYSTLITLLFHSYSTLIPLLLTILTIIFHSFFTTLITTLITPTTPTLYHYTTIPLYHYTTLYHIGVICSMHKVPNQVSVYFLTIHDTGSTSQFGIGNKPYVIMLLCYCVIVPNTMLYVVCRMSYVF